MAKRRFQLRRVDEEALQAAFLDCKDGPTRTRYQAVRLYGIRYRSRTSYYNLFKKCGFSYRQQEKRFMPVSSATV